MSTDTNSPNTSLEYDDNLIDKSIDDAKWMLAGVAIIGLFVIGLGLFASTLAV